MYIPIYTYIYIFHTEDRRMSGRRQMTGATALTVACVAVGHLLPHRAKSVKLERCLNFWYSRKRFY